MVSAKRRAVRIFGREYTVILPSLFGWDIHQNEP